MIKAERRKYLQVLRLLETFEMGDLQVAVINALRMGAIGFDAVKHLVLCEIEQRPLKLDLDVCPYLFVAIDRATRWVFIRIYNSKTAANARRFLRDLKRACPTRIRMMLTDNGKEFTDRLFSLRKRSPTGKHEFDLLCNDLSIEHRLAPPQHPQTNGMVERFNGRIEEVLQSYHFSSGDKLETTLHRYVALYNQQLSQSALGSKTPLQAIKDWQN